MTESSATRGIEFTALAPTAYQTEVEGSTRPLISFPLSLGGGLGLDITTECKFKEKIYAIDKA